MRTSCWKSQNLRGIGDRVGLRDVGGGGEIHHFHFVVGGKIVEHRVEQEAIELRFGQRIGAFQLDGVLRRQHEERRLDLVLMAAHRARQLLHGFEQRRLRLGRRAVDFVGQQDVGKNRSGHEGPGAASGGGVLFDDVGAGDVGRHQVGRELDALEHQAERLRQRPDQQRLGRSRQAGDQTMAAHEQRDHHLFDDLLLSDNDLADFANDAALDLLETLDPLL